VFSARVWDYFIVNGPKALHRVSLALLFLMQGDLLECDVSEAAVLLTNVPKKYLDIDIILQIGESFKVTRSLLKQLTCQHNHALQK
jgi:hypothetical protein